MFLKLFLISFKGITGVLFTGIIFAFVLGGFRVNQQLMDAINKLLIRVTLPCLIFYNMAVKFKIDEIENWWIFPILGIGHFFAGGLMAYIYTLFDKKIEKKEIFISSVAFHNSFILPIVIAPVLFHGEKLENFFLLLFLYNLLAVPAFFSLGLWLMNSGSGIRLSIKHFINPPNIATIAGFLLSLTGLNIYLPEELMETFKMFGIFTTPLSMIIVGVIILKSIPEASYHDWSDSLKIMILKCLVFPSIVFLLVYYFHPSEYIALFLVMGSTMPVGFTLAAICPPEKKSQMIIAGGILFSSLASVFAVSFFMSLYNIFYSF